MKRSLSAIRTRPSALSLAALILPSPPHPPPTHSTHPSPLPNPGRLPSADIHLKHLSLSRAHARLTTDGAGGLAVTDMGSAHGTNVDGAWIKCALHPLPALPAAWCPSPCMHECPEHLCRPLNLPLLPSPLAPLQGQGAQAAGPGQRAQVWGVHSGVQGGPPARPRRPPGLSRCGMRDLAPGRMLPCLSPPPPGASRCNV